MYEQLKELPDFSEHCDARAAGALPTIQEIRNRHLLLQRKTLQDEYPWTGPAEPVRTAADRLTQARRLLRPDLLPVDELDSCYSRPYLKHVKRSPVPLEPTADRDVRRIVDQSLGRPHFAHDQYGLDFLGRHFYRDPLRRDLKLAMPRRSYAGSLVERTLYW